MRSMIKGVFTYVGRRWRIKVMADRWRMAEGENVISLIGILAGRIANIFTLFALQLIRFAGKLKYRKQILNETSKIGQNIFEKYRAVD